MPEKKTKLIFQILGLAVVIAGAFYLAHMAQESVAVREFAEDYGYVGIFIISLISGFNLAVPIPAVAFMPLFLESGLSFWSVVLVITVGVTCADSIAFFLAKAGSRLAKESLGTRIFDRLYKLRDEHPRLPLAALFVFASIAPLPNELMVVPLAFLGYRYIHIAPIVLAGHLIFTLLYAKGIIGVFEAL